MRVQCQELEACDNCATVYNPEQRSNCPVCYIHKQIIGVEEAENK